MAGTSPRLSGLNRYEPKMLRGRASYAYLRQRRHKLQRNAVMAALVAAIHALLATIYNKNVDARDKPAHDGGECVHDKLPDSRGTSPAMTIECVNLKTLRFNFIFDESFVGLLP